MTHIYFWVLLQVHHPSSRLLNISTKYSLDGELSRSERFDQTQNLKLFGNISQ